MANYRLKVEFMDEAWDFIESLPQSAADKILDNVHRIESGERNPVLFSKLDGSEIWEFRTLFNRVKYRLFAFWDTEENTIVITTHGIIKKTQKTPPKEISKAERIRTEYFKEKEKQK